MCYQDIWSQISRSDICIQHNINVVKERLDINFKDRLSLFFAFYNFTISIFYIKLAIYVHTYMFIYLVFHRYIFILEIRHVYASIIYFK